MWQEFEATWWGRFKARRAYRKIDTPYKIIAELRGKVLVGQYRTAGIIALDFLYLQLGLGEEDIERKIDVLETVYFLESNKRAEIISDKDKKARLQTLELLCAPYVWGSFRNGKIVIRPRKQPSIRFTRQK